MTTLGFWPFTKSPENVGREVLQAYFDEAKNFTDFQYSDFEQWVTWLNSRVPDYPVVIGDLVLGNSASTTVDQAVSRVKDLANQSGGTATIPQIVLAAGGKGDTINWFQMVPDVAEASAEQIIAAVQDVGAGVLSTVKMTKYLPWILLGAGALFIYTQGTNVRGIVKKLGGL